MSPLSDVEGRKGNAANFGGSPAASPVRRQKACRNESFVWKSGRFDGNVWHSRCVRRCAGPEVRSIFLHEEKIEGSLVSVLFAGTAFIAAWWGAHHWLPSLASRHGAGIDAMLNYLLLTTGTFVTGYVVLAYSSGREAGATQLVSGSRHAGRNGCYRSGLG